MVALLAFACMRGGACALVRMKTRIRREKKMHRSIRAHASPQHKRNEITKQKKHPFRAEWNPSGITFKEDPRDIEFSFDYRKRVKIQAQNYYYQDNDYH